MFFQLKYYPIYLFFFLIGNMMVYGQDLKNLGLDNKDKVIRLPEVFVVESEIDPQTYILGPGDKIGLSIITSANRSYVMTITPMGDLWIPDVGAVHVSGMDIKTAEMRVSEYIKENRFKSAEITLVILNIRHFKIQVIGAVLNPGFVTISSVDRLTDIIRKSGGLHKLADEDNILLSSADDKTIECSLKSFHLDGDLHNNPVIQDGDVVHVPYNLEYNEEVELSITHNQSLVFVTGFVVKPMGHRFIPGYTINDYIAMSGGVNDFGSLKKLSIYRHDRLFSLDSMNILQPGDQIDIPANMRYRMLGNISILQTVTAMMTLYLTYQAAVH